jgi:predicted unusual protein kinase regulating ubiquinone biosynthesis (AarF/ABC1/UbiB family)
MVGELPPRVREQLLLLVMAFWQEDDAFLAEVVLSLAGEEQWPDLDLEGFEREISALFDSVRHQSLTEIQLGPLLQGITQVAARHDVRLPASLALTAKALAQMQLAAGELDPDLDPLSVVPRFLFRSFAQRMRMAVDPRRAFYEVQKVKVRLESLFQALERMSGARPGPRFSVDLPDIASMEVTIRRAVRRIALAATAAATIVATAFTAASDAAPDWLSTTFGVGAAVLSGLLIVDFLWPKK